MSAQQFALDCGYGPNACATGGRSESTIKYLKYRFGGVLPGTAYAPYTAAQGACPGPAAWPGNTVMGVPGAATFGGFVDQPTYANENVLLAMAARGPVAVR